MFFCIYEQEDKVKKLYSNNIEEIKKQTKSKKVIELFESQILTVNDFLTYKTENIESNLNI